MAVRHLVATPQYPEGLVVSDPTDYCRSRSAGLLTDCQWLAWHPCASLCPYSLQPQFCPAATFFRFGVKILDLSFHHCHLDRHTFPLLFHDTLEAHVLPPLLQMPHTVAGPSFTNLQWIDVMLLGATVGYSHSTRITARIQSSIGHDDKLSDVVY